jgi:inorganic pyrophosphatase
VEKPMMLPLELPMAYGFVCQGFADGDEPHDHPMLSKYYLTLDNVLVGPCTNKRRLVSMLKIKMPDRFKQDSKILIHSSMEQPYKAASDLVKRFLN